MAYVEVEVDIEDFDWGDIVDHVQECGHFVIDTKTIQDIFEARSYGSQERVNKLIDELIYNTIGRTV